jgi:hypothetical protein
MQITGCITRTRQWFICAVVYICLYVNDVLHRMICYVVYVCDVLGWLYAGDTAANAGALALLDSYDSTRDLPVFVKTLCASASAGTFRIFLMPLDACKTIMQVWCAACC